jgi:ubiquinone biosynthesis accessory factor UbiJ
MIADLIAPQRVLDRVAELVNRLLRDDEAASAQLAELAGRSVEVQVTRLGLRLCLAIESDGILLATRSAVPADVVLEGNLVDFIAMARAHRAGDAVPAGKVRIQGDLATVRQLEMAFDSLSVDWEAQLARVIGNLPARQVGRAVEGVFAFLKQAHASVERDVSAYLLEEAQLMPTALDIEHLGAEALRLDMALDRCAARLARLERKAHR